MKQPPQPAPPTQPPLDPREGHLAAHDRADPGVDYWTAAGAALAAEMLPAIQITRVDADSRRPDCSAGIGAGVSPGVLSMQIAGGDHAGGRVSVAPPPAGRGAQFSNEAGGDEPDALAAPASVRSFHGVSEVRYG